MNFTVAAPGNFNLWSTVMSHGWCVLAPFRANKENRSLQIGIRLSSGKSLIVGISERMRGSLAVSSRSPLNRVERTELAAVIASTMRLEEDYSAFYREAKRLPRHRWIVSAGAGRLLRAPTVFEDVLKMMCTTNCSWALTEIMVKNLCKNFGEEIDEGWHTFPSPEAIADSTEKFLRQEIRAGYRSPYILELSKRIADKKIDPESWRQSTLPTKELYNEVHSVKGIGPYAAGNILKLLGRYDFLGIDSWCRKKFFELHKNGRRSTDKTIERFYEPFGIWRGLFFWLEVTKDWYGTR